MREILFRGKTLDENEWVEGGYSQAIDMDDNNRYHFVLGGEDEAYFGGGEIGNFNKVDGDTVSQYIGQFDKTGRKIFEGDILEDYDEEHMLYVVEWDDLESMFVYTSIEKHPTMYDFSYSIDNFEVIGNKWDNPELLEVNND